MRELVLTKQGDSLRAFLLEQRHLVEYHEMTGGGAYALGDIFLGEITQVIKGLNAAFVQLGLPREGFLHYSDIGCSLPIQRVYIEALRRGHSPPEQLPLPDSALPKEGSITDYLQPGDWLLVQVVKEMSDTKGPRLSTQLSLTGQALVLLPFSPEIGISQRITDPLQRQRWREELRSFYRPPYGMILRTTGQFLPPQELQIEYEKLISRWETLLKRLSGQRPPYRLSENPSPLVNILQEYLSPPPKVIHTEDEKIYVELQQYLQEHTLPTPPILRLHRKRESLESFLDLERTSRLLLGRTVTLPNGGYIVIEHTEALHVIDVNSGSLPAQGRPPEEIILQTNLLAAQEIARQLRLRDLGGIIVIDFIDMRSAEHRQRVYERLCEAMKTDRAKHIVLPMSDFGLVQITRQRRRAPTELEEVFSCPTCYGSGKLTHPDILPLRIETQLRYWGSQYPRASLQAKVHPMLLAYWKTRYPHKDSWIWNLIPHRWLKIEAHAELPLSQALLFIEGHQIATIG
ncbi:MAG: Rne/Rng family ribonuclease [Bacteroidia bacterium]|nr:Rne/Rng family ribonuclease [Bacteroidia bacterium]